MSFLTFYLILIRYDFLTLQAHCYNDLHIFDTDSVTWEAVATEGKPPSPRAGAAHVYQLFQSCSKVALCVSRNASVCGLVQ